MKKVLENQGLFLAEKERFELSRRYTRPTPLAGAPLRPLEYFSVYSSQAAVAWAYDFLIIYDFYPVVKGFFIFLNFFLFSCFLPQKVPLLLVAKGPFFPLPSVNYDQYFLFCNAASVL